MYVKSIVSSNMFLSANSTSELRVTDTYWVCFAGVPICSDVKYRSSSILVIICKMLAKLWLFSDLVFVVGVQYKVKILFLLNNVWRDVEVCCEGLPLAIRAIIRTSVFLFVFCLFVFLFFVFFVCFFFVCFFFVVFVLFCFLLLLLFFVCFLGSFFFFFFLLLLLFFISNVWRFKQATLPISEF